MKHSRKEPDVTHQQKDCKLRLSCGQAGNRGVAQFGERSWAWSSTGAEGPTGQTSPHFHDQNIIILLVQAALHAGSNWYKIVTSRVNCNREQGWHWHKPIAKERRKGVNNTKSLVFWLHTTNKNITQNDLFTDNAMYWHTLSVLFCTRFTRNYAKWNY